MNNRAGFTLVEVVVGMVIFTIGVMGFTGMTLMMSKGQQFSKARDESATLSQTLVEDLAGIPWADLGTDTGAPAYNGLTGGEMRIEGPLNRNGEEIGTGNGPYKYMRYLVVCTTADSGVVEGGNPDYCGLLNDSTRPQELACDDPPLSAREKLVRIVVSYTDKYGECHKFLMTSLAFDWGG